MFKTKNVLALLVVVICAAAFVGCGPKFPLCKTDKNCSSFKDNEGAVHCINGHCQQCGKDADCPEGKECKDLVCVQKPECRDPDILCKAPLLCKNNKCVPECTGDGDCGTNFKCQDNKCVPAYECAGDADCGPDKNCKDSKCEIKPPPPVCETAPIYFDFDKADLRPESKTALDKNAECINKDHKGASIVVEGNCDERGTAEYNINLGMKRAEAAKKVLKAGGVKNVKTMSYGKERPICRESTEDCWQKNRRDDVQIQK